MKKQSTTTVISKQKSIIVNALYAGTMMIIFLGMFFIFFSLVNHISFKILNVSMPGLVLGFLVLYLGIRYYFQVIKLKSEVFKASSEFSWSNFKRKKKKKLSYKK